MSSAKTDMNQPQPNIRTCQIIAIAMYMGVLMFGGVAIVMRLSEDAPPANQQGQAASGDDVMLWIAIGLTATCLVGRAIVLSAMDRQLQRDLRDYGDNPVEPEQMLGRYQTRLIVGLALLEGPAFFCLVALLSTGNWEALGPAGFLLLVMVLNFPTETKLRNWVETNCVESNYAQGE